MNLFTKKILLILLLLTGSSASQDCTTSVSVKINLLSEIYINDSLASVSSGYNASLKPGKYKLTVKQSVKEWNGQVIKEEFILNECESKIFNFNIKEKLLIQTIPSDASVYLDDSLAGYTPLKVFKDFNSLKISKHGYQEKLLFKNDLKNSSVINLDFIGNSKPQSFYQGDLFKILIGSLVLLGGTTAYFKLQADDYYEQYQLNGDESLLKKTKDYDLISGVSFGLAQINFGYILYSILSE
jgi:hypothetical protein